MEASTTIRKMLRSAEGIIVPSYQRAYAWETPTPNKLNERKNVDVFLSDLEEYSQSNTESPYYFGHFLFEQKNGQLYVVDGQQRLTTIVIFLSALFECLKTFQGGQLVGQQKTFFRDMVKDEDENKPSLRTVNYDDQFFQDYVINKVKRDEKGLETESAKRIVKAFSYFCEVLKDKDSEYLCKLLDVIVNAACTTHTVTHEAEAVQMFIFQNSRGKKPSKLELIKAKFMLHIHLYGGNNSQNLISEITNRFSVIYKSISSIGYKMDEDSVLRYTLHIHRNTLAEIDTTEFIDKNLLSKADGVKFVVQFAHELELSFNHLKLFFCAGETNNYQIHSLIALGGISIALPFILKAYRLGLDIQEIGKLCQSLESLVLRDKLIGTKADLSTRLNTVFVKFSEVNPSIQPIIDHINTMKKTKDWWWAYWSNQALENSLQGWINPSVARFLLWKYENYLKKSLNKSGYKGISYTQIIENPELEHIAPTTEPTKKPHGYDVYDDDFKNKYLDCLGNYLLISKSHNSSIGNTSFAEKYKTYTALEQQREIQSLLSESDTWTREIIEKRHKKIVNFILAEF